MAFKRQLNILEGSYIVEITNVELLNYPDNRQALKLKVRTYKDNVYGNFLIFTNNVYLIDRLIDIVYDKDPGQEIDEQDFVGIYMEITTREKNGYINIVDINPVEFEEEEEENEEDIEV